MSTNFSTFDVLNPFDNSIIETLEFHSEEYAFEKLNSKFEFFNKNENLLEKYERIAILEKIVEELSRRHEEFTILASSEGGKPYIDSKVEVDRAIQGIKIAVQTLSTLAGKQIPMSITKSSENRYAFTIDEPIGIVYAISAFNHPLNLIIHQVVTAFAAGCPVIIKPDLRTPLSCIRFVELMYACGVPQNYLSYFLVKNDIAEKLVSSEKLAFFSFIGSSKVGWYLKSKLAPGVKSAFEHGGAAPVILADQEYDDTYLENITNSLCKGAFYHSGQVCVSVQRVFVHHSISQKLIALMKEKTLKLKYGNQLSKDTELGPIIEKRELDRIDNWVQMAINEGSELVCGGKILKDELGNPSSFYEATILLNPNKESLVSKSEIFGPVVCIYEYQNLDEAVSLANSLPFSFQSAIFTANIDKAFFLSKKLKACAVMINDHTAFRTDWMPFGGRQESGMGIGGINYTIEDLTYYKLLVFRNGIM